MKYLLLPAIFLLLIGCDGNDASNNNDSRKDTTSLISDTVMMKENETKPERYENEAFRAVRVENSEGKKWKITGEARVFEASFSYYIEDGHNQLTEGNAMADNGAPAWGNFTFEAEVDTIYPHTHPHLVLYEASAKDGRPTNELVIPLHETGQ